MRGNAILIVVLISGLILAGCVASRSLQSGTPSLPQSPTDQVTLPAPAGPVKHVIIRERAFDPDIITVSAGTTVIWTNEDPMIHRVVHLPELPREPELFHSEQLSKGDTFRYTFPNPGEYYYGDPQMGSGRRPKVIVQ